MSGRSKNLLKNTALIGISKLSVQVVLFFMLPVYTANLSTAEYGTVELIVSYGGLLAPLIMLNLQQAVFRELIEARSSTERQKKIITNSFEIILIVALAASLLYALLSLYVDVPLAVVSFIYICSFIFSDLVLQVSRGVGNTKAFAFTGIAQGLLTVAFNLILIVGLGMGASGMLIASSAGLGLPALILFLHIKVYTLINIRSRSSGLKRRLLGFSIPLIPHSVSWWLFNSSDRTIISAVLGVASTGIYAVSLRFASIANSFSSIFYASWSETAIASINDKDRDVFFSKVANSMVIVFSLICILIMSVSPIVFPYMVGDAFHEALLYLPLLALGTIFNTVVSFYSAIYIAKKMTKQVASTSIVAAIISVVVNLSLIYFIGLWAAAISNVLAYGVMAVYRHYDMKKYVKISYNGAAMVGMMALFIICASLFYVDQPWASLLGTFLVVLVAMFIFFLNRGSLRSIIEIRQK